MGLINTTKKLSLTLIGLSYLCAAHAADASTIVTGIIKGATDIAKGATGEAIKTAEDAITIDRNDCGKTFSKSGKIFILIQNMECSVGQGDFALEFSGDHNIIFLNKHSITAVDGSEPNRGILITGNENHVIGSGTVEGFGTDIETGGNIVIENAGGNHVSELTLSKGVIGVLITTLNSGSAQANHIYHNHIQDVRDGIVVAPFDFSSADANQIYDNHIQATRTGIVLLLEESFNSSADANQIYDNHIQNTRTGISLFFDSSISSADANQIHDNHIQDIVIGISIVGGFGSISADDNQVISNHIIRPERFAIELDEFTTNNLITNNFTKDPQQFQVYCDDAGINVNDWGTNFIDLVPTMDWPGFCA